MARCNRLNELTIAGWIGHGLLTEGITLPLIELTLPAIIHPELSAPDGFASQPISAQWVTSAGQAFLLLPPVREAWLEKTKPDCYNRFRAVEGE